MKRKEFLKMSGGLALAGLASNSVFKSLTDADEFKKIKTFGLQLYTLRADLPADPRGVIKQVASFGYKQIEGFEGPKGMFWGMTNKEFKSYMDDLGTTFVASHCDVFKDFEKKVDDAAAIGVKYLIWNYEGPGKTNDDYRRYADDFNKKGELCKKNGIKFAFHNHDYSFKSQNGVFPQDIMLDNTDPSLVYFEMDIYWVVTAGLDPEEWFKKHKNRFRLCHIKDRKKDSKEQFDSCDLGTGSINYAKILKTAKKNGVEYFIVEQEKYDGTTPLKAVEANAKYMKVLSI